MGYSVRRSKDYDSIRGQNLILFGSGIDREWEEEACWEVFDDKGSVAGFCSAQIMEDKEGPLVFLSRAGVLPHARGNGLQRRMIKVRCKYASSQGCEVAVTYTTPSNVTSANNLIKEGFVLYTPQYKWAGKDQLYWIKDLKSGQAK